VSAAKIEAGWAICLAQLGPGALRSRVKPLLEDALPAHRRQARSMALCAAVMVGVFEDGSCSMLQPGERKHILQKVVQVLEDNAHELAVLESLDSGKPVSECQNVDVPETIHTIRWHAELQRARPMLRRCGPRVTGGHTIPNFE